MKNFDEFFLSNLTDLKKEVQTKNPHKAFDNVPGSPKKNMTLAEYKEQVKQQHSKPTKTQPQPTEPQQNYFQNPQQQPANFQNYLPQTQGYFYNYPMGIQGVQPQFYNHYPGYQNQNQAPISNPNPMVNMANNQYSGYQNSNINQGSMNMANTQYSGYQTQSQTPIINQGQLGNMNPNLNMTTTNPSVMGNYYNNATMPQNQGMYTSSFNSNSSIAISPNTINLNPSEEKYYHKLYSSMPNRQLSGDLPAKTVVDFIKTSNLHKDLLKKFWLSLNKPSNNPDSHVSQSEFFRLLKMIALAQNNIDPSAQNIGNTSFQQLPVFHNVEEEDAFESFQVAQGKDDEFGEFEHHSPQLQKFEHHSPQLLKIKEDFGKTNENNKKLGNDLIFLDNENENHSQDDFEFQTATVHNGMSDFDPNRDDNQNNNQKGYDKYNVFDEILDVKKEAPAKQQEANNLFPENKDTLDFNNNNNNGTNLENNPKFITKTFQTPQIFEKPVKKSDLYNPFSPNFTKKTEKSSPEAFKLDSSSEKKEDEFFEFQEGKTNAEVHKSPTNQKKNDLIDFDFSPGIVVVTKEVNDDFLEFKTVDINFQTEENKKGDDFMEIQASKNQLGLNKNEDFMEFDDFKDSSKKKGDLMEIQEVKGKEKTVENEEEFEGFQGAADGKIKEVQNSHKEDFMEFQGFQGNNASIPETKKEVDFAQFQATVITQNIDFNKFQNINQEGVSFQNNAKNANFNQKNMQPQPEVTIVKGNIYEIDWPETEIESHQDSHQINEHQQTNTENPKITEEEKQHPDLISARKDDDFEWVEPLSEVEPKKPKLETKKTEDLMDFDDQEDDPQENPIKTTEINVQTVQTAGIETSNFFDWKDDNAAGRNSEALNFAATNNNSNIKDLLEGNTIPNKNIKDALEGNINTNTDDMPNVLGSQLQISTLLNNDNNVNNPNNQNDVNEEEDEFEWNEAPKNVSHHETVKKQVQATIETIPSKVLQSNSSNLFQSNTSNVFQSNASNLFQSHTSNVFQSNAFPSIESPKTNPQPSNNISNKFNDFDFEWNEAPKQSDPQAIAGNNPKIQTEEQNKPPQIASKYDLQELFVESQQINSGFNILDLISQAESFISPVKILNLSNFSGKTDEEISELAEALFSLEMYEECQALMEHHKVFILFLN